MKKHIFIALAALGIAGPAKACINTISNNTNETFKLVEITQENLFVKSRIFLPNEYLHDEHKARTIKPGEEVAFGGHYVPTFMIYKKYLDELWHPLLIVKQRYCGPRDYESKYLLMTDLLKRDLPGDYKDVYKFSLKKAHKELDRIAQSVNEQKLTKEKNPYQTVLNILDNAMQEIQELMSMELRQQAHPNTNKAQEPKAQTDDAEEIEDGGTCPGCAA